MKKQLLWIAVVTAFAQLAGFFKLWLVARYFGVSAGLDGYNLAFVIPTLVSGVVAGALQTGLFPVHAQLTAQRGPSAAAQFEALIFWSLAAFGALVALSLYLASSRIGQLIAYDATESVRAATVYVLKFAAFGILLNIVGDFIGYLLALRGKFLVAAAAPTANALVGAAILVAWPTGDLAALTIGTLFGLLAQVAIVFMYGASDLNFISTRPKWTPVKNEIRELVRLGLWILPGVAFANVTNSAPMVLISSFGDGAVSAFGYAFRLHQTAVQFAVMAASPVILARFSVLVANAEWKTLNRLQARAFILSGALGLIVVMIVAILGGTVVESLFAHGRFDQHAVERVSSHWLWLSLGFGVALYGNVLAKRIQAHRGAFLLTVIGGAGTLSLFASSALLRPLLGEFAVSTACALAALCTAALMSGVIRAKNRRANLCADDQLREIVSVKPNGE